MSAERPAGEARTMRYQSVVNKITTAILRSPLAKGPGQALVLLHVVGRKTGRHFDVPVAYARDGDALVVGTPFAWARNMRTGEPVEVHYMGKLRVADVEVRSDVDDTMADYAILCRVNKQFAKFNNIRRDAAGDTDPADLRAAWEQGGPAYRLTLR
ncbi:nitroreductase/quinone reductase family protein [Smaragdicoccus niigatensis]|uniref:nitroreductase/quinone reductase family protein n=1 Tax=Smaragdicoccus niigatensis TaxID=359359 RepID=UPI0003658C1E|nr:nitroreductase/quinone reductase family protein [Smaragdicoccus niigatensis]